MQLIGRLDAQEVGDVCNGMGCWSSDFQVLDTVRTPDDVRSINSPCNHSKNVTPYAKVYVIRNRKGAGACGQNVGERV